MITRLLFGLAPELVVGRMLPGPSQKTTQKHLRSVRRQ